MYLDVVENNFNSLFLTGFQKPSVSFPVALGIDPDSHGSLCAVTATGELVGCLRFHRRYKNQDWFLFDNICVHVLHNILHEWIPCANIVAIEQVHAMPGEGVSSVFKFGKTVGELLGSVKSAITHHGRQLQTVRHVHPRTWQASFGLNGGAKAKTRDAAKERWPAFEWPAASGKPDTRISDGAFIAAWGAQLL